MTDNDTQKSYLLASLKDQHSGKTRRDHHERDSWPGPQDTKIQA